MNREEVVKVLAVLQTAYPAFYRQETKDRIESTIALWCVHFKDKEYRIVSAAVNALIATKVDGYPPTIGAVNAMIQKLTHSEMTEQEAWGFVRKAISNSLYNSRDEWERLPEEVKRAVTPDQLRTWALDMDFNESVASSNFMRSYRARSESERQRSMIPLEVKNSIAAYLEDEESALMIE